MSITSWIQSSLSFVFSNAHADELEKSTSSLLQRVQDLKKDVDTDARTFTQEKIKFQTVCAQAATYSEQAVCIEQTAGNRLPALVELEEAYTVDIDKVVQVATLALVPESVTALKKELNSSMVEYVAAGKKLADAFEALEKLEKVALTTKR